MIICSNCGASNKPGSTVCRMCAYALPEAASFASKPPDPAYTFPPTLIASEKMASGPTEIECPNCHTLNEGGWSFCQQCGSRLPQAAPPPMPPRQPAPPPVPPSMESSAGFKTVPTEVPRMDQGLKTVVADRPKTEPISPPPGMPMSPPPNKPASPPPGMATVAEPMPPKLPPPPPDYATVVAPPPIIADQKPAMPQAERPRPEPVQPIASPPPGTTACPKCGHANGPGNSFCANCGSALTVARTIVMASPQAVPKARLHLVMEGGQQGDVFELSDETVVGRNSGDITFPHDGFMSGQHARIERRGASYVLTDAGSRNGTFIKIKGEVELKPGDMILIGKQLFRFEV